MAITPNLDRAGRPALNQFRLLGVALGALLLGGAGQAVAQSCDCYDDEIVVEGHYGRVPDDITSLSQVIRYDDLDLYYREDRAELRRRITATADHLCRRLGESNTSSGIVPSCRDAAVRDALRRVGTRAATYVPRDSALVGARWEVRQRGYWEGY